MKFCYVDETGNSDKDPIFIMVGIIIDEKKLHKYSREVGNRIRALEQSYKAVHNRGFNEIKTHALIEGKKGWSGVDAKIRKDFCFNLCKLAQDIPLNITLSGIDFSKLKACSISGLPDFTKKYWQVSAIQTALEVQSCNQGAKNNKGKTVLIFDNNQSETPALSEFVFSPDPWIEGYYEKPKKAVLLDEIVDTAFTIKSDHSGLVQVADCYAYVFRRYFELVTYKKAELWTDNGGELSYIRSCLQPLKERLFVNKRIWGTRSAKKIQSIDFYRTVAPDGFSEFMAPALATKKTSATTSLKTGT